MTMSFNPLTYELDEDLAINDLGEWFSSTSKAEIDRLMSQPVSVRVAMVDLAFVDAMAHVKGLPRSEFLRMLAMASLKDLMGMIDSKLRGAIIEQARINLAKMHDRAGISVGGEIA